MWVFWRVGTINSLDSAIDLKTNKLGELTGCKERLEHPTSKYYTYEFYLKKGWCPEKEELKDIESARLKLCKEIKSDLEELENKSFKKPIRSAKERYEKDFLAKGLCSLS